MELYIIITTTTYYNTSRVSYYESWETATLVRRTVEGKDTQHASERAKLWLGTSMDLQGVVFWHEIPGPGFGSTHLPDTMNAIITWSVVMT